MDQYLLHRAIFHAPTASKGGCSTRTSLRMSQPDSAELSLFRRPLLCGATARRARTFPSRSTTRRSTTTVFLSYTELVGTNHRSCSLEMTAISHNWKYCSERERSRALRHEWSTISSHPWAS